MSIKGMKISEIIGYCKHNNVEYLCVEWENGKETWEKISSINAKDAFFRFIENIEKDIECRKQKIKQNKEDENAKFLYDKLIQAKIKDETDKNENKKEDNILSLQETNKELQNKLLICKNNNEPKLEELNMTWPILGNEKPKETVLESVKNLRGINIDDERIKRENKIHDFEIKRKKLNKPIIFEQNKMEDKNLIYKDRIKNITNGESTSKDAFFSQQYKFKYNKNTQVAPIIEMRRAPAQRYFDYVVPASAPKIMKTDNAMKLKFENSIVGSFSYPIGIESGHTLKINMFNVDKIICNSQITALLFNLFMNPALHKSVAVYRLELLESIATLDDICNKMKNNNFGIVDIGDPQYLRVFLLDLHIFKRFGYNFNFYMVKILKTLFNNTIDDLQTLKIAFSDDFCWSLEKIRYNTYIENYIIFMFDTLNIKKNSIYYILSPEKNPISDDLNLLLKNDLIMKTDKHKKIDYFFVHRDYLQFINAIYNIEDLLLSHTKFYAYDVFSIREIFPRKGIVTVSSSLLTDINQVGVLSTLRKYESWKFYITRENLDAFKDFIKKFKNDLRYHELNKLYAWLSSVSIQFNGDEVQFISHLRKKYYYDYRFFYIIAKQNTGKNFKTFDEIEKIIKKHSFNIKN